jgi:hypothetical protein
MVREAQLGGLIGGGTIRLLPLRNAADYDHYRRLMGMYLMGMHLRDVSHVHVPHSVMNGARRMP